MSKAGTGIHATPTVMLKGKWLSEFGFDIGHMCAVRQDTTYHGKQLR